jgi:hypothetical protein
MLVASSILWQYMKCVILENLSITTKIKFVPLLNLGKPRSNFIDISTQSFLDTDKGVYKLWCKTLDLAYLYVMHLS